MNLLYYNNKNEAVSKLTDSLSCVFTSSGALTLLKNIWNQEIEISPKDYKIYERIADISSKAGPLNVSTYALHLQDVIYITIFIYMNSLHDPCAMSRYVRSCGTVLSTRSSNGDRADEVYRCTQIIKEN